MEKFFTACVYKGYLPYPGSQLPQFISVTRSGATYEGARGTLRPGVTLRPSPESTTTTFVGSEYCHYQKVFGRLPKSIGQ
jgi:hypothetical protein